MKFIGALLLAGLIAAGGFVYLVESDKIPPTSSTTTTTTTSISPGCISFLKEERKVIDMYLFLLGREEIRVEEDRKTIAREFHQKLAAIDGNKKDCQFE